jgi:hypothetical protein
VTVPGLIDSKLGDHAVSQDEQKMHMAVPVYVARHHWAARLTVNPN